MPTTAKFPFKHAAGGGTSNRDWWPNQLRLDLLHQHSSKSDPMGEDLPDGIGMQCSIANPIAGA